MGKVFGLTCSALGHMQFSEELSPVCAASAEDSVPVGLELVLLLLLGAPMAMAQPAFTQRLAGTFCELEPKMEPRSKCFALPRISGRTVPVTGHSSSMLYPSSRGKERKARNGRRVRNKWFARDKQTQRKRVGAGAGGTYLLPRTCCTGQIQLKCWCRAGKQLPPDPYHRPLSDMCAVWPIKELFAGAGVEYVASGRWQVAHSRLHLFIQRGTSTSTLAFSESHMQRKIEIIRL